MKLCFQTFNLLRPTGQIDIDLDEINDDNVADRMESELLHPKQRKSGNGNFKSILSKLTTHS